MEGRNEERAQLQREALWKWRWLGWRNSTPAFKVSMAVLGIAALAIIARVAFG